MNELYLKAIIKAPDAVKLDILRIASKRVSIQELELLSSAARLSTKQVRDGIFNPLWRNKMESNNR